jgi:hypothetical protein
MAGSTWLTWPDVMYDFGTHLYVPWQIVRGKHLYTDIAYFNGPLSEYFNAAMFAIFGVSVHTLMLVNGGITIGVIALIFSLIHRLSDTITATAACGVFVFVFAFSRYIGIGNYNWICPYTHEVTHGVALALVMLLSLGAFLCSGKRRWLFISSILLALASLTKAEVFAPAAAAFAVALLLRGRIAGFATGVKQLPWAVIPVAAVLLIVFASIAMQTSAAAGGRALLGSWPWVFNRQIARLQIYQRGLGTDQLAENLRTMLIVAVASCSLIGGVVFVGVAPRRWRSAAWILLVLELGIGIGHWRWAMQIARPWPIFLLLIAAISFAQAWRGKDARASLRAVLSVYAFGMLGKMIFSARVWQYGFALALPAAIALVEAIMGWLPALLASRGYDRNRARLAAALLIAAVTLCLYLNQLPPSREMFGVGGAGDRFLAEATRGGEMEQARLRINALLPPGGTLSVMPQGLMLNFLTRRSCPIAVINIMPPEVISVGEDRIIQQLDAQPPDLIVLSERDIRDGAFILTDGDYHYGRKILAWVIQHYHAVVPADAGSELKFSYWMAR